jgi:ABC-type multidrug transport system ATPase subunit
MLTVTDLSKVLGGKRVLDRVTLEVGRGQIGVVLGANGSGKSTLLRLISGILRPDHGDIVICGMSMRRNEVGAKRNLGYVPDATEALPDLLVREFGALVSVLKRTEVGRAAHPSQAWIERLALHTVWGQSIASLSLGQRKRMYLLAAMCGDPWLLVMDEPSNGLDPDGTALVVDIIEERRIAGLGTLLSTHESSFASGIGGAQYRLSAGTLVPA